MSKMFKYFLVLCTIITFISNNCYCQKNNEDSTYDSQSNSIRFVIYIPSGVLSTLSLEHKITRNLSVTPKGTILTVFGNSNLRSNLENDEPLVSGIFSIEFKYFYSQKRRLKNSRVTNFFSGPYFGFESYISSNSLIKHNQNINYEASQGIFLNFGFQTQIKQSPFYFNAYAGYLLYVKAARKDAIKADVDPAQIGIGLGYRF